MSDDFDFEPIRGLPEIPPAGEAILWQGAPDWRRIARDVYHIEKVAIYFGLLLLWAPVTTAWSGSGFAQVMTASARSASWLVPLAIAALGMLCLLAWLTGKTTVYTITSRRIVMRIGIALPMTFNLPFRCIGSADLRAHADGTGDIPVSIMTDDRIAYLVLWPHARPWRIAKPEPAFRAVPDAANVAHVLAQALGNFSERSVGQRVVSAKTAAGARSPDGSRGNQAGSIPQDIALAS